jgi:hypothetical protein
MMGLFTPAWKSKNENKALRAVEKMTDQKKLERVAKGAESGTEMPKTLTLEGFENSGLIAAPTPTKGTRAPSPWTAYAELTGGILGFSKCPLLFSLRKITKIVPPLRPIYADSCRFEVLENYKINN